MTAREMFERLGYRCIKSNNSIWYINDSDEENYRSVEFYFCDCTFDAIGNYGDPLMVNVKELEAINKQCEEIGWLEEEKQEKQETNYEHYKDKIIEDGIWNLALVNGPPKRCHNVYCNDCDFKTSRECKKKLEEWLKHPYKKLPYKLSQFEFDIIQTYRDCHESCKISEFKQLIELKDKGYFKCIDHDTKIQDVLKNCEVIQ